MPKANILVLDDDPVVRRALTDTLADEGYQVATAADGIEGLEKARGQTFDILLVDLKLPDMDGIEVLREIRKVTPEVIVILMTAYATLETAKEAMQLGAYDYLAKPLDPDAVTALLEKALEKRRLDLEMKAAVEVPRILVVDDEAIVCQALADILGNEGYRVTTVQSAYQALDTMKRETFNILIADLRLPDLDGIELINAARGIDPEILALVITGYPSIESAVEAMKTSACDYITKPIDPDLLVTAVRRGWERQRLSILNKQLLTRLQRTNEELKRRLDELSALQATSAAIQSSLDLQQVLEGIADSVVTGLGYRAALLGVINEAQGTIETRAMAGPLLMKKAEGMLGRKALDATISLSTEENLSVRGALAGEITVTHDLHEMFRPLVDRATCAAIQKLLKVKTLVGVPLLAKGKLVGSLGVATSAQEISDREIELLKSFANQTAIVIENARLYSAEQQRAREFSILFDIAGAVSSTLNLPRVLKLIARKTAEACHVNRCSIFLLDEKGEKVAPIMSQFASGKVDEKLWHVFKEKTYAMTVDDVQMVKRVIRERQPVVLDETSKSLMPETWIEPFGIESLLMVPLISKDRVIGALALDYTRRGQRFTDEQVNLAATIGSQVAMVIENAQLFEAERRKATQLRTIGQVGQQIASLLNLDELLHRVVSLLVDIFGYYYANVLMVDEEAQEIVLAATAGQTGRAFEGLRLKIGEQGITGWVAGSGEPLLVNDVDKEPRYYFVEELADTKSELAVPIKLRGEGSPEGSPRRVIGVLDVQSVEPGAFDEMDLSTLTTLADQLAVAIENARLYQETERLAITDGLTGLYNRRHFYELLEREVEAVKRYDGQISLIMLDIDHFKVYNDTYGHLVGDALLRELARLLVQDSRKVDVVARYGGDEFVILLPHTDKEQAVVLAERIRTGVEEYEFWGEEVLPTGEIAVSVGVATCPEGTAEPEALVRAADMALLEAKKRGNRVCVYGE